MASQTIRFFPRPEHQEARTCKIERLTAAAWKFAHCALWPEQDFSCQGQEVVKNYIRDHFTAATELKRAFTAFIQRIILTQKYTIRSTDGLLPAPAVWFNLHYPFGFAGTLSWLRSVDKQRQQIPGYLAHIEAFARGYYRFAASRSGQAFQRCRQVLLKYNASSLLQLFYTTIAHTEYLRA
jgi:hypothetical protein